MGSAAGVPLSLAAGVSSDEEQAVSAARSRAAVAMVALVRMVSPLDGGAKKGMVPWPGGAMATQGDIGGAL